MESTVEHEKNEGEYVSDTLFWLMFEPLKVCLHLRAEMRGALSLQAAGFVLAVCPQVSKQIRLKGNVLCTPHTP